VEGHDVILHQVWRDIAIGFGDKALLFVLPKEWQNDLLKRTNRDMGEVVKQQVDLSPVKLYMIIMMKPIVVRICFVLYRIFDPILAVVFGWMIRTIKMMMLVKWI
jgi:hypothetical protein